MSKEYVENFNNRKNITHKSGEKLRHFTKEGSYADGQ